MLKAVEAENAGAGGLPTAGGEDDGKDQEMKESGGAGAEAEAEEQKEPGPGATTEQKAPAP